MPGQHEADPKGIFDNNTYNVLKFIAQILLPALGTLYLAIAQIWGLPFGREVGLTIAAIDTFLGIILGLSSRRYADDVKEKALPRLEKSLVDNADGDLKLFNNPEMPFLVELNRPPEHIAGKKTVTFVVKPQA
jgi:hypothetical protein